jgi:lysine-N-methylase
MALLHPTRRIQALVPLYAERFSCIGSECEDSCCAGWTVAIDKKTFNAYRQSKNPHLAERLETQVKRIRSQASDKNYARMELTPATSECPMIEDHLCSIQKELGEDKLSHTCFTFPRTTHVAGGFSQQSLTLSCPEAARLALLAGDAFEFNQSEILVREETLEPLKPKFGISIEQMNEIRFFCIQLMRGEGLDAWQKLAVLGLFCESLTAALKSGGQSRIPQIMESTRELIRSGECKVLFNDIQQHYEIQAVTFTKLWHLKSKKKFTSDLQRSVHQAIATGLGADPETGNVEEAQLIDRYRRGIKRLPEALIDAPFLMENYVVNEMWRECFPFDDITPYEHYLRLVIRFGLVRFMLAAQCSQENSLPSPDFMAQTVQTFCRRYQHDSQFMLSVNNCLNNSGWNELNKIYRLLII